MASAKDKITAIAVEHGYAGKKPKSVAGAINALADTLAGKDVEDGRSISGAVDAIAPYIGSGGGGAKLGNLVNLTQVRTTQSFDNGWMFPTDVEPFVGINVPDTVKDFVSTIMWCGFFIGSQPVVGGEYIVSGDSNVYSPVISNFAVAGLTAACYISYRKDGHDTRPKSGIKLYRCKVDGFPSSLGNGYSYKYASVSEFTDFTVDEDGCITFVIPDFGQNDALVFYHGAE